MTETPDHCAVGLRWHGILGALVLFWLAGATSALQAPRSEAVSFHNGNVRLSGTLYLPVGKARHPGVVVFHAASGGGRDFHAAVSAPGVSPAAQMDYAAARALRASDQPPGVIERALRVRAVVNDYYRGRAAESQAEQAVAEVRNEPWFGQVFLPNAGDLPRSPTQTKWHTEMDYDPLNAISRVRVPIVFFFAETDAWVPVEESIASVRRAAGSLSAVTIARIRQTDHLMETGPPDSGGPTSEEYVARLIEWLDRTVGQRCRFTR